MPFLLDPHNAPFSAALVLMLLIGVLQVVGLGGLHADADHDLDAHADGGPAALLDWLNGGRLPLLMLLVVFLFGFGVLGLALQRLWLETAGRLLPMWAAAPAAVAFALPVTRALARGLARVLPGEETTAVARDTLVGRVALIVTGVAEAGRPAQARLRDEHGQRHHLMLEPAAEGERFVEGETVLIVRREGATFYAVRNDEPALQNARF